MIKFVLSQVLSRVLGSKLLSGRHGKDYSAEHICAVIPLVRSNTKHTLGAALLLSGLTLAYAPSWAYEAGLVPDAATLNPSNSSSAAYSSPLNNESLGAPSDQPATPNNDDYPKVARFGGNVLDSIVQTSQNLAYERKLRLQHDQLVERYHGNLNQPNSGKQPANKTEPCLVNTDLLDGIGNERSLVFWEGSCQNGLAEGFGRVYLVDSGRKTFELLGNFHSDEPQFTTIYYAKNTTVKSQTVYFYGKANRYQSSGITINSNHVDNDLLVSLQFVDKVNLVTYQKTISKNSKYILNIEDFGNYVHFIHDLSNTPYSTLTMSYRLLNRATNGQLGYSFTGLSNGSLQGYYRDEQGTERSADVIPEDVLTHIERVNEYIDVNIESCIENVIKAVPVIDAYLQVICSPSYSDAVCDRMQCKQMCQVGNTITPEDNTVKSLLLRLVQHHNDHPLRTYLAQAIEHSAQLARSQQEYRRRQAIANLQPTESPAEQIVATAPVPTTPQAGNTQDASAQDASAQETQTARLNRDYTAPYLVDNFPDLEPPAPSNQSGFTSLPDNNTAQSHSAAQPQTLDDVLLPANADAADIAAARQRLEQQRRAQSASGSANQPYVATERTTLTSEEQRLREEIINTEINRTVDANQVPLIPPAPQP